MKLCPRELEALLIHQAGYLAQKRLARGCLLNQPEAVALIASQIQELARDGFNVAELMDKGRQLLGRRQVLEGVCQMIKEVQAEATFPDGSKLVTVHFPVCQEDGNLELALYGSFLPVPVLASFQKAEETSSDDQTSEELECKLQEITRDPPGCIYSAAADPIEINKGRKLTAIRVSSVCDRPIQVGSHYNFLEANKRLIFDRKLSYGKRLNIPSGNAVRFEPGESMIVTLVDIGGNRLVRGGNNLCDGPVKESSLPAIMQRVIEGGFGHKDQDENLIPKPSFIPRVLYAKTYGPTTGDKVRLGDTSLIAEVEIDFTVYGDECKFGGGKVLRDGMGQTTRFTCVEVLDTVITNCLVIDPILGIVKADVGIKDGKIAGIGKAGNIDTMDGVTLGMFVGAGTEAIAGEGSILTAGGVDSHIHYICPQQIEHAIASGVTTMIGGGTGPSHGSCATTCTPGPNHIKYMIQSTDEFPLNFGFTGKGNTSKTDGLAPELVQQVEAGAIGLKLHEDWGTTPAAIKSCIDVAEALDVQVLIHTDTLNESSCVEETIAAFGGKTIHTYHTEGAGGGHAPDIISVCGELNVLPSSTNPTRPFTINTIDEALDMLMVCHHLDKNLPEDIAFAESRIRGETVAAEDILHDMGAISIISSDSQAMGRVGEVISRTWQTADKMKIQRGKLNEERGDNDNFRVKRYIAKYTINPAIAQGISHVVGSIAKGKLADLVLWNPAFFGAKPSMIIKGGQIAWSLMGNPNASIPTAQPLVYRKMFGAYGKCTSSNSLIFVSKVAYDKGTVKNYGIKKIIESIRNVRQINKRSMILNDYLPVIKVDPEQYSVHIKEVVDGEEKWKNLTCQPAKTVPLAQRYFLF